MKRRLTWVLAGLALMVLAPACRVVVDPFTAGDTVGADATAEATLVSDLSAAAIQWYEEHVAYPGGGTPLTPTLGSATLPALAGQVIRIVFTNGVVDSDTLAAGIALYPLTATIQADGAYTREAALIPTPTVVPDVAGGCTVELAVDLSGATVSTQLELVILGNVLTANNGTNMMDLDLDGVYGEANEDDWVPYITVTGAPVAVGGVQRSPRAVVAFTGVGRPVVGQTTIVISVLNSAGGVTEMTAESLAAGLAVAKFAADAGTWTALTPTHTYDGAGSLTATFPAAFVAGDLFRWTRNTYLAAESAAVRGYVHRAGYNGSDPGVRDVISYSGVVHTTFLDDVPASRPEARSTAKVTGLDYSAVNKDFSISSNGGAPTVVTLSGALADLSAVVTALNAALSGTYQASEIDIDYDGVNDSLMIARIVGGMGSAEFITLAAGTTDALGDLGIAAGLYVGRDLLTGTPFAGFMQSSEIDSDYARWVELYFDGTVNVATVTSSSVRIIDNATNLPVEWTSVAAMSGSCVRISMPGTFQGNGNYILRIYPAVTDAAGVPYADTSISGTRDGTPLGAKADDPFWQSGTWWTWN